MCRWRHCNRLDEKDPKPLPPLRPRGEPLICSLNNMVSPHTFSSSLANSRVAANIDGFCSACNPTKNINQGRDGSDLSQIPFTVSREITEAKSDVPSGLATSSYPAMVNPEVPTPRISTFVLYSPKSSPRYEDNSGLSAEDLQTLKNEFAEGGTLVSVYSPDDAMLWLEAHYDDPPLTSMRLLGVGGPIAAMLSPDEPSLVIFGSIHDNSVLAAAGGLSELSGFHVMIRPLRDNPITSWEQGISLNEDAAASVDDQLAEANQDVNNDFLTNIVENEDMDEDDTTSVASDISMDSTTTEDSDIRGINNGSGVFRFRGGASKDVDPYEPWMGPVHNVDV
ncbi:hypothetical protein B0H13DRAFT_1869517 [Mycena leptocephala]|nr:hypothetical protein B0H13DRAFT_1869517 [Mycena leptocephala]